MPRCPAWLPWKPLCQATEIAELSEHHVLPRWAGSQQQGLQNELTHTQWQDRVDGNGGTKSSVSEIWTSGIISFKKCNLAWDFLQAFFFFSLSSFHQTWLYSLYIYCAYEFQCFCFFRPCKPGMVTWERLLHLYRIHSWLQLKFTKHIPRLP